MFEREVIRNSFENEVLQKQMILHRLSYDLTSKLDDISDVHNNKTSQIVQGIRKIVESISQIFQDLETYFEELFIDFASQLINSSFKLLSQCFNGLSLLFLAHLRNKPQPDQPEIINNIDYSPKFKELIKTKKTIEIQYLDSMINEIEIEEEKLIIEQQQIKANFKYDRQSIHKVKPSEAVFELQQIRNEIQRIIDGSEAIRNEITEIRQDIIFHPNLKVKTPTQFFKMVTDEFWGKGSNKVGKVIVKLANILFLSLKDKMQGKILSDIENQKMKRKQVFVQTEINQKKIIEELKKQVSLFKRSQQTLQENLKRSEQNQIALEDMLRKKLKLIQQMNSEYSYQLSKKDELIKAIREKNKREESFENSLIGIEKEEKNGLSKTMSWNINRNQKQLKKVRDSIKSAITALQNKLGMKVCSDNELDMNINLGRIQVNFEEIGQQIQLLDKSSKSGTRNRNSILPEYTKPRPEYTSTFTQTTLNDPLITQIKEIDDNDLVEEQKKPKSLKQRKSQKSKQLKINKENMERKMKKKTKNLGNVGEQTNLDQLKMNLIRKIRDSKMMPKMPDNQSSPSLNVKKQKVQKLKEVRKQILNSISFEELTFKKSLDKKGRKTIKNKNSIRTQTNETVLTESDRGPKKEAIRILKEIEINYDNCNSFLHDFVLEMLNEVKHKKGGFFYQSIMNGIGKGPNIRYSYCHNNI